MNTFEVLTMICFGASWPFAIAKTYRYKTARGKSFLFLSLVLLGYISAVAGKLIYDPDNWVVWLWALNGFMVATDLSLSLRYRRLEN